MCGFVLFIFKILTIIASFESLFMLPTKKNTGQCTSSGARYSFGNYTSEDLDTISLISVHECLTDVTTEEMAPPLNFCRIKFTFRDEYESQFTQIFRIEKNALIQKTVVTLVPQ
jgi:hypothetical protein